MCEGSVGAQGGKSRTGKRRAAASNRWPGAAWRPRLARPGKARLPALAVLVGDLPYQHLGGREAVPRGQGGERLAHVRRPPGIEGVHRRGQLRARVRDEGGRKHGVDPDEVELEADDGGRALGIVLVDRPWRGRLKVLVARDPKTAEFDGGLPDLDRIHLRLVTLEAFLQTVDECPLLGSPCAARRHLLAEFGATELRDAGDEVAEDVGEVLVHARLEVLPCELRVRAFGRVGEKPPTPVIGWQDVEGRIHEDASPLRGRELAAVVVEIIERLDVVDELPRLPRPDERRGEGKRVERHVVLAHELHISNITGPLVGAPPTFPVTFGTFGGMSPFGGGGDVFDGRVEPDVEDLTLHAGPGLVALPDRNAPVEVAGDAAVLQALAVVEPFLRD